MKLPTKPKEKEIDVTRLVIGLYAMAKTGKTTFAAQFPDALFIPSEPGHKFVEINQICDDNGNPITIRTWKEFKDAARLVLTTKHEFKTIVLDTIDGFAAMAIRHVNAENGWKFEGEGAYGMGSALIKREFTNVIDALLASGLGVVFISHERELTKEDRGVKRPFTDLSLSNTFKNYITGACDLVLYAYRTSDGKRMMRTKANDNVMAGDRSALLPEVMPLDYKLMVETLLSAKEKVE